MAKKFIWIFNAVIIVLFGIIMLDFFGLTGSKKEVTVTISEGDGISVISEKLKSENIVISKNLFNLFCKIGKSKINVTPGTITVNSNMSYKELAEAIEKVSDSHITVTIPEGFETREIADRLVSNDILDDETEFFEALKNYTLTLDCGTVIKGEENSLSGFLFPDTYNFYEDSEPQSNVKV